MKVVKLIFTLLIFMVEVSFSQNYSNVIIISDLDDTYKVTNSASLPAAFWNATFTQKTFSGMDKLYAYFKEGGAEVVILSNSNRMFRNHIRKLFRKDSVTVDTVCLRPGGTKGYVFKTKSIEEIISLNPDSKFVFLGDDVSKDAVIYQEMAAKYPDKVLAIYIRPVRGIAYPASVVSYQTAFDIALSEFCAGRLSEKEVLRIGNQILNSKNEERIKPHFLKVFKPSLLSCSSISQNIKDIQYKLANISAFEVRK
jgi:phosphatidate phosphatase APP1